MDQPRLTLAVVLALTMCVFGSGTALAEVVIKMPPPPRKAALATTSYEVHRNGARPRAEEAGSLALSRYAHARIGPRTRFFPVPKVFWYSNGPVGFPGGYGGWSPGWRGFGCGGFRFGFGLGYGCGFTGFSRPCF